MGLKRQGGQVSPSVGPRQSSEQQRLEPGHPEIRGEVWPEGCAYAPTRKPAIA